MCASVRNAFVKYALQVKGQIGHVCLVQLGLIGVSWGKLGSAVLVRVK